MQPPEHSAAWMEETVGFGINSQRQVIDWWICNMFFSSRGASMLDTRISEENQHRLVDYWSNGPSFSLNVSLLERTKMACGQKNNWQFCIPSCPPYLGPARCSIHRAFFFGTRTSHWKALYSYMILTQIFLQSLRDLRNIHRPKRASKRMAGATRAMADGNPILIWSAGVARVNQGRSGSGPGVWFVTSSSKKSTARPLLSVGKRRVKRFAKSIYFLILLLSGNRSGLEMRGAWSKIGTE